ncbi:MAG: Hsp20/alpha crystallin family protein, partial [Solirubrobacterales bacterium]
DSIGLEVVGRDLVISGERPIQETEGRVYQQVEIQAGPFRRVVELSADPVAEEARATYDDGILRVELPLRARSATSRSVPIETGD